MKRRSLITVSTTAGISFFAGCASNDDETFEPDVTETIRLGTVEPLSFDSEVNLSNHDSEDFEAKATEKANVRVHDYIGSLLREQELLGAGVFLGIDRIPTDEIDDEVEEEDFNRAIPLATVVNQRYVYDEDGELIIQPEPVELDTLREQLPRTVAVDVSSNTDEYSAILPVVVHRFWTYSDQE